MADRVLIFAGPDYEDLELWYPKLRLEEAGYEVTLAGDEAGKSYQGKHGYPCANDAAVGEVKSEEFAAVVCPGGWMPDKLRRDPAALRLLKEFDAAGKPVAAAGAPRVERLMTTDRHRTTRGHPGRSPGADRVRGRARRARHLRARLRQRWRILGVLCLSLVLIVAGNSALNVALPTLVEELRASQTQLQWIVDAYAIVFAGLLLPAGAIGDRYGRRGALQAGLAVFAAASLAATFATTPNTLIATRAVMGLGAAFVMPATLSLLTSVFLPRERGRAIATWAGFAGAGGGDRADPLRAPAGAVLVGFGLRQSTWCSSRSPWPRVRCSCRPHATRRPAGSTRSAVSSR